MHKGKDGSPLILPELDWNLMDDWWLNGVEVSPELLQKLERASSDRFWISSPYLLGTTAEFRYAIFETLSRVP